MPDPNFTSGPVFGGQVKDGVIILSVISLLTLLGRTFMDFRYVFPEEYPNSSTRYTGLAIVFYMAFFGGWIWALLAAQGGSNGGMTANLIFNLITGLGGGLASYIFFRPFCASARPIAEISVTANLIFGITAAITSGLYLM